jgi:hypothetical protein
MTRMCDDDYDTTDPAEDHAEAVVEMLLDHATEKEQRIIRAVAARAGLLWACPCGALNPNTVLVCRDVLKCGRPRWADASLETLDLSARTCNRLRRAGIDSVLQLTVHTRDSLADATGLGPKTINHIHLCLIRLGMWLANNEEQTT